MCTNQQTVNFENIYAIMCLYMRGYSLDPYCPFLIKSCFYKIKSHLLI